MSALWLLALLALQVAPMPAGYEWLVGPFALTAGLFFVVIWQNKRITILEQKLDQQNKVLADMGLKYLAFLEARAEVKR